MSTEQESGVVEVDGIPIPYFDAGSEVDGRPPLLLLHGAGGSADTHFSYLFSMLAFRQRVLALDFRKPNPVASGYGPFVRQVLGVIDHLLPQRTIGLLGYGLGAVVAAAVAADAPGRIDPLVLVAGWIKTDAQQRLRHDVWRALRHTDADALRKYVALTELSPSYLVATGGAPLPARPAPDDDLLDLQMEVASHVDLGEVAPRIQARTLLVAGTADQVVPRFHLKQLLGAIDDARYVEIASGHAMHIERPAELFQRVDDFMRAPSAHPAGSLIAAARP